MTREEDKFPVPSVVETDQPFWDAAQKGVLLLQKCRDCGRLQFFPRPVCVYCFSTNLGWQESKGTGTIYSFALVHVANDPVARKHVETTGVPFIFTLIDLDEGVRITSEIVGCEPGEVTLGARVSVTFVEAKGTNFKLPKFQLAK